MSDSSNSTNQDEFPARIRNRRRSLGSSLEEIGNLVGVNASYIAMIEQGVKIPKAELARRLAISLKESEEEYIHWAQQHRLRKEEQAIVPLLAATVHPLYPEARAALIDLCEDQEEARQLFVSAAMGPLEAALYGLLVDRMAHRMGDLGFWGFIPPRKDPHDASNGVLLLEAFFEMLTHPEGETADYKKVFGELLRSWRYGPGPHRISVVYPDNRCQTYRLALVDSQGTVIPALEPEDPFYTLYRMMTPAQRGDLCEFTRIFLRRDKRIEIQAALEALTRWHDLDD